MPKITDRNWTENTGGPNPLSGQDDGPSAMIALGDQVGLKQFGVHLERLPPRSRSSHRHWHETEDEFVYVLSGELVLIEETETVLRTGDAAGWRAGSPTAHCLENRSSADAIILVVGARAVKGAVHYPDHDVIMYHDASGRRFTRLDGTPI
ncbi:cupin domain-containing protein [Tabrizicola sp.]|uniref:cupin domain-containing protein n=1 Tax=Tabrizicola sp. TaxID=2005166 RepID=UPI003F327F9E